MKTSDFEYVLPPELIAQTPIEPRDSARLLVIDRSTGSLAHRSFHDLPAYLRPGDLLVGNDSRVIPARLHGTKPSGGRVELFLVKPVPGAEGPAVVWECLVRGKGLRPGVRVKLESALPDGVVATVLGYTAAGGRLVAFNPPVQQWLWEVGEVPLPPYIHESLSDPERYQTIYSRVEGSVASSTAGLHFTPELMEALHQNGVRFATVTLHIGIDTFRPVQEDEIERHAMHREWARLEPEIAKEINQTRLAGGRIVAVGTTAVRTLETAARLALGSSPGDNAPLISACGWQTVAAFEGETDLFIRPGDPFRVVDAMITNFHLPRSTLLMLVSAFAGKELIERAYTEAIRQSYRFYSFGDATLIL